MTTEAVVVTDTQTLVDKLRSEPFRRPDSREELKPRVKIGGWRTERERIAVLSCDE